MPLHSNRFRVSHLSRATARALALSGFAVAWSSATALAGPVEVLRSVAFHPSDAATYAVVYSEAGGGVLITRDGGASFALLCAAAQTGIDSLDSRVPQVLWSADGRLLFGGFDGLYRSDPRGCASAAVERLGSVPLRGLARDPGNASVLYAATASGGDVSGLYVSRDAGASWEALQESDTLFYRQVIAQPGPEGATRLAVSTAETLDERLSFSYLLSDDGGKSFERHALPDAAEATLLGFDAKAPDTRYAAVTQAGDGATSIMMWTRQNETWSEVLRVAALGSFELDPDGGFVAVDSGSQQVLRISSSGSSEELTQVPHATCLARQPGTGRLFVCRGHRLHEVIDDALVEEPLLELTSVAALVDCGTSPDVGARCQEALAYGYCSPTHYPQAPICQDRSSGEVDAGAGDEPSGEARAEVPGKRETCAVHVPAGERRGVSWFALLLALAPALAVRMWRRCAVRPGGQNGLLR